MALVKTTSSQLYLHIYKYINLPSLIIDLGGHDHIIVIEVLIKAKKYFLNESSNLLVFTSSIHSFSVYWPSAMCPGTVDEAVNKTDTVPALMNLNPHWS